MLRTTHLARRRQESAAAARHRLLRHALYGESSISRVFLTNLSDLLVGWIISPRMNGICVWIAINDDALWRLPIDNNDRISASGGTAGCE